MQQWVINTNIKFYNEICLLLFLLLLKHRFNVVLVSGIQKSNSIIHIFLTLSPYSLLQDMQNRKKKKKTQIYRTVF